MSGCDFLLGACSTPEPLIDADVLNALSPGCLVINTARSSVLDNDELARQVKDLETLTNRFRRVP